MYNIKIDVSREETIEIHSNNTKWILGISIFMVALFGVGAGLGLPLILEHDDPEAIFSFDPRIGDVSLAENETEIAKDTPVGKVDIIIDYDNCNDLPLCLTTEYMNKKWSASAEITGYDLVCGWVEIKQKGVILGYAEIDWGIPCREPCWTDDYWGTFTCLYDAQGVIVDHISLGSNRWPADAMPIVPTESDFIPGKKVKLTAESLLKGCDDWCQHFTIKECTRSKNTVEGSISVVYDLPINDLCLTQADLDLWTGTMEITGYDPVNGTIEIWQKDELLTTIKVEWVFNRHERCYTDYYDAVFTMDESYVALYSNQWPCGADPVCDSIDPRCDPIPEKELIFKPQNLYKGCTEEEQMFLLIMAHEIHAPESPTLNETNNFIAKLIRMTFL